jgi:hypothetical protein
MEKLARLTREDNLMMQELTEKAARDTDTMRWITFLTLIYLPASFVSVSILCLSSSGLERLSRLTTSLDHDGNGLYLRPDDQRQLLNSLCRRVLDIFRPNRSFSGSHSHVLFCLRQANAAVRDA